MEEKKIEMLKNTIECQDFHECCLEISKVISVLNLISKSKVENGYLSLLSEILETDILKIIDMYRDIEVIASGSRLDKTT